jgi:hypothetical protein
VHFKLRKQSAPRRYKTKKAGAKESFLRLVQLSIDPGSAVVQVEDFVHDNHVAFLDLPFVV